ncbi:radical SAM protein [Micromonospora rifamycinica]|uniref:4Fe-4S single cluster domain-containing protein n=1 Tax=Micromonospora rifamycinica TaxID=291594 RepID=UPI002E2E4B42|nr:4Fe-4S single cluster domain-containing protein [Micromonospora rifamycinica]
MSTIRVNRTHFPVTALGPGTRFGVWVQGCPLACAGCMSLDTWDAGTGTELTVADLLDRWADALARGAGGITVSGGEPLAQPGPLRDFLTAVDRTRSDLRPAPDILLYTGYELAELNDAQRAAAALADVLVTGRFLAGQPTRLLWRGSANQRMVLQTDLGRRRYASFVDLTPDRTPLQVEPDPSGVWIIGTPRRGTLSRLERGLRHRGLGPEAVTWRPE